MISFALGITLKYVLKNHIYTFNNKLYLQEKIGAIGVAITGDVAVLFMAWWHKELLYKLQQLVYITHMYGRYVNDINIVVNSNTNNNNEEEIMQEIQTIANSIHPSISVTIDNPNNNQSKRLPVLDLEMCIDIMKVGKHQTKTQILHSHYSKPISNKHLINKNSALSTTTKKNILVADLVRITRNISPLCNQYEGNIHIQAYLYRMQFSGYDQTDRVNVYQLAKKKYEKIIDNNLK